MMFCRNSLPGFSARRFSIFYRSKSSRIKMGRKEDPFWRYVEKRTNKRWMCKFCGKELPGGASRIKRHLAQVGKEGVVICDRVDDGVRKQALKALGKLEPTVGKEAMAEVTTQENVPEDTSSTSSWLKFSGFENLQELLESTVVPPDASHGVVSQLVPPSTEFGNDGTSLATQHTQFQSTVGLPGGGNPMMDLPIVNFQPHNEGHSGVDKLLPSTSTNFDERLDALKRKVEELTKETEEKEEGLHHLLKKVKKIKITYEIIEEGRSEGKLPSLQQINQLEMSIREVEGLGNPGVFTKALSSATHNNNHPPPLITTNLIGHSKEMSEIWNHLVQDDILRVGIYGMGGVGKTEIARHIYNKLLENKGFNHVFWATMPQDFTIYKIQEVIGNAVQLDDLLKVKHEFMRAARLHEFLISKKKSVLILDGLWKHFEFNDAGIPVSHGLKLVITSRSLNVCRKMLCQAWIRISPIRNWHSEGLNIFLDKLGPGIVLSSEMKKITMQLLLICQGLPLYITTIARRMRAVEDVHDWNDMLEKMKDPKERFKEMKHDVYDTLKLSYDSLDDHQLQQCLIFSAFYISHRRYGSIRRDLVEFLIDVGLIWGADSRRKLTNKAYAILDKLKNASLLDGDIKMHGSTIDMVSNIRSDKVPCMSHFGFGLKDLLDEELWFEGLDKIAFVIDGREEGSNESPKFSKISVLLSEDGPYFEMIPDVVLRLLPGLRILDLSYSNIEEIPHSVSDLISLTALVLRYCDELVRIPYIGKLTSLMKLDLYCCCSLTDIPDGLECVVELKYLNLRETGIGKLPRSILGNLTKLQYLGINDVEAEELVVLNKLESLFCCFSTMEKFSPYARIVTDAGPSEYDIHVGREPREVEPIWAEDYDRAVSIVECGDEEEESHGDCISLPKNIQYLCVDSWSKESIMLSDCAPLKDLEALEILNCKEFGVIFGEQNEGIMLSNSNACPFPNLKKLNVASCSKLKYILGQGLESGFSCPRECDNLEGIIAAPSTIRRGFPNLEEISISSCRNMRSLLVPDMLPWLQNLRRIHIVDCNPKTLLSIEVLLNLPHLNELDICGFAGIEMITEPASPAMPLSATATTHLNSNLTSLKIYDCHEIKRLFSHELLVHLYNLQTLEVQCCEELEGLTDMHDELSGDLGTVTPLPNLKILRLKYLPQLRSIGAISNGPSIEIIEVFGVWELKRIPLQMSQLPDGRWAPPSSLKKIIISREDYNWWESLEWEPQGVKEILRTYVQLADRWNR